MNQRTLVIILFAILLAATLVGAAVLTFLPSDDLAEPLPANPTGTTTQVVNDTSFDVSVFQRSSFTELNLQPLQTGVLPVRPPQGTGKANPFL